MRTIPTPAVTAFKEVKKLSNNVDKSLTDLKLREKLNLNVVAERGPRGLWHFVSPKKLITPQTVLLIVVEKKNMAVLQ